MFLDRSECWDKHFVDDVHDPVVGHDVRPDHMCPIDRDALSYRGSDCVPGDIAQCIVRGIDFFLSLRRTIG
jgi:hypothetical protein